MKVREVYARALKARILSWLQGAPMGAVISTSGGPVVFAVYNNGKYVKPETVTVPNDPRALWLPDGPFDAQQKPEEEEEEPEQEDNDGTDT